MYTAGIITVSDKGSRGEREDVSGPAIKEKLAAVGSRVIKYSVIPDEKEEIAATLAEWADGGEVDVILTTGGTGFAERDVTPEATQLVIDKSVPGFGEAMRLKSLEKTPMAMLSRATAGIRGKCLIINLPGSPKAVSECLDVILPAVAHGVEILRGEVTEHSIPDAGVNK